MPKSNGSSAPSATAMPASTMRRSGTSPGVGVDPEGDVAAGADLERHAGLGDRVEHLRVLDAAHAVADAVGVEVLERLHDRLGAEQLAAVRHEREAGAPRDGEGRREVGDDPAPLVVGQPEADDVPCVVTGVVGREPGERAGLERVAHPARRDDDGHPDARPPPTPSGPRRARSRGPGVMPPTKGAYDVGSTWISSQRDPSAASSARGLAHDAAHVGLAAHARPGGVVEPLEAEPAALVGGPGQSRRPVR